jgi:kynurenine 3-monooxygenase
VAALARYVRDSHTSNKYYTAMYDTTCQYVDYENKQVLVRNVQTKKEEYIPYDLLIGCDGVRSVVREALIKRHSDFTCKVSDIFQEFKAVHVDRPKELSAKGMSLLPNIFKNCQGIALPETGGKVNISIGVPRNLYEELDEELKSNDYKVVSKYFKENFKAFELVDYDDYAKQWVGQRWNQTGMVHCNKYHSSQMNIVIMGDAAHATSPSIGMGMNTALRDARVFYQLLKENKDDIEKTLPLFSEARVKEGNSLSSLAFNLYCLDSKMQTMEVLHMIIRTFLHKKFPKLVTNHPQNIIGMRDVALSDVYDLATRLNIIPKLRARNELIQHQHFEKLTGMTKPERKKYTGAIISVFVAISAVVVALKVKE